MASLHRDKIIVLRVLKYGEADLVVHGLNPNGHRLNFIARSALKSRKRFGGGILEATHLIEVAYQSRSSPEKLSLLNEAQLIDGFSGLRERYERLETALYFLQLVSKVSQEGLEDSELFLLLARALQAGAGSDRLTSLRLLFELKFLHLQGVLPHDFRGRELCEMELKNHAHLPLNRDQQMDLAHRIHYILRPYAGF